MQPGNIYKSIPEQLPDELFETLHQNPRLKLERIVSEGHVTPGGEWFDQEWDEWVILLSGSATLGFESEREFCDMLPGDYVFIPAHCRHRVERTDAKEKTVWLALHIQPEE